MSNDRLKFIINNLLNEICTKVWDAPAQEYVSWLKNEIGLTDEEITELKDAKCFQEPSTIIDIER